MSGRHWAWITAGLGSWAVLAVLWATGPHDCQPPDTHGHVTCAH